MRIRLFTVVLIALAATLPLSASTVDHSRAATVHHRSGTRSHARRSHRTSVAAHRRAHRALETHDPDRHTAIADIPRVRWVPPLRGSHASLVRQNERDTAEGLLRIEDDEQLGQMEAARDLSALP